MNEELSACRKQPSFLSMRISKSKDFSCFFLFSSQLKIARHVRFWRWDKPVFLFLDAASPKIVLSCFVLDVFLPTNVIKMSVLSQLVCLTISVAGCCEDRTYLPLLKQTFMKSLSMNKYHLWMRWKAAFLPLFFQCVCKMHTSFLRVVYQFYRGTVSCSSLT